MPSPLDLEAVIKAKSDDVSALHVVLFQEIERYNIMLSSVRRQISELRKAVKVRALVLRISVFEVYARFLCGICIVARNCLYMPV